VVADHPCVYPKVGWRVVVDGAETLDTARTLRDAKPLAEARWYPTVAAVQPLVDQATAAEQRPSVLAVLAPPPTGSSPGGPTPAGELEIECVVAPPKP
jgi:hypothetical protein